MSAHGLAIIGRGMVTPVGLDAASSCAAIRVGIDAFEESRFMFDGDWVRTAEIPLDPPVRGRRRFVAVGAMALREAARSAGVQAADVLFCTAAPPRTPADAESMLLEVAADAGVTLGPGSRVFSEGRVAPALAIEHAAELLRSRAGPVAIVAADSLIEGRVLESLHAQRRLLTEKNSDGLIPGEAAAAVVLDFAHRRPDATLRIRGVGRGLEPSATDPQTPLRGEGLLQALRGAVLGANLSFDDFGYRITDLSGEQNAFKEASIALIRATHVKREEFDLWHPAECIGDTGAAALLVCLIVAEAAQRKSYAPSPGVILHASGDDGARVALAATAAGHAQGETA